MTGKKELTDNFNFKAWYSHVWLANFIHPEDFSYVEGMVRAGMVDRVIAGRNFPHESVEAANFQVVRPNIHQGFTAFRYR